MLTQCESDLCCADFRLIEASEFFAQVFLCGVY